MTHVGRVKAPALDGRLPVRWVDLGHLESRPMHEMHDDGESLAGDDGLSSNKQDGYTA